MNKVIQIEFGTPCGSSGPYSKHYRMAVAEEYAQEFIDKVRVYAQELAMELQTEIGDEQ